MTAWPRSRAVDEMRYHRPESLEEALAVLAQYGDAACILAGGTALTATLQRRPTQPSHLVSLGRIQNMADLIVRPDGMDIGAMCTHRQVETSPLLAHHCRMLAAAYGEVATLSIREMATVGGGLAHADPAQDPAPALMVLDGRVVVASPKGTREVPLTRLFTGPYTTSLRQGEVIASVRVPPLPRRYGAAYVKHRAQPGEDYGAVNVAAYLEPAADGSVVRARVALSGVAPTPVRARAAERALRGRRPTPERLAAVAELVRGGIAPATNARGPAEYKADMAVVFTRRALERAARFDDGVANYRPATPGKR